MHSPDLFRSGSSFNSQYLSGYRSINRDFLHIGMDAKPRGKRVAWKSIRADASWPIASRLSRVRNWRSSRRQIRNQCCVGIKCHFFLSTSPSSLYSGTGRFIYFHQG